MIQLRRILQAEANVAQVVLGKEAELRLILLALMIGRHVLIQDVPGVGKTTLVRAIAASLGCSYRRIQFTPDLLPSDITGVNIYDPSTRSFRYRAGPLMAQIVLADEINRTSPKTQAALLEAMEERQVTVDGETHALPEPFLVLATQNPLESEGTYPLPESQWDRFAVCIRLGYPDAKSERDMLTLYGKRRPLEELQPSAWDTDLLAVQQRVRGVYVSEAVTDYIVRLVQATRNHPAVRLGASPRAALHLFELSRAAALIEGRNYVNPDDVKKLAEPALAHRLMLHPESVWDVQPPAAVDVVRDILARVEAPIPRPGAKGARR